MPSGGARKGAGRKPDPDNRKLQLNLRLARDVLAYLDYVESKTQTIEDALRGSKGYREWKRNARTEADSP